MAKAKKTLKRSNPFSVLLTTISDLLRGIYKSQPP
jgi:hypothetical protein